MVLSPLESGWGRQSVGPGGLVTPSDQLCLPHVATIQDWGQANPGVGVGISAFPSSLQGRTIWEPAMFPQEPCLTNTLTSFFRSFPVILLARDVCGHLLCTNF